MIFFQRYKFQLTQSTFCNSGFRTSANTHLLPLFPGSHRQSHIVFFLFYLNSHFLQRLIQHFVRSFSLFRCTAVHPYHNISGAHGLNHIFHPCIQRQCAGNHNQYHGAQNTDIGKPRGVLFHPVNHTGYGNKVAGPVIISFFPAHQFQYGHTSRCKKAVSSQNYQKHRCKKHKQRIYGIFHNNGNAVSNAQCHKAN